MVRISGDLESTHSFPTYPLSFAQQRLAFIHEAGASDHGYLFPINLLIRGPLDVEALRASIRHFVERHAVLRSRIIIESAGTRQEVCPAFDPVVIENLSEASSPESEALARVDEEAVTGFQLDQRLIRVRLLQLGPSEHVLLVSVHHIAFDGWSCQIFYRELSELYSAAIEQRKPSLESLGKSYGELAVREHEKSRNGNEDDPESEFWAGQVSNPPDDLALPSDRPRPELPSAEMARLWRSLGNELTDSVERSARNHRVTVHMLLLAAFQATLAVAAGQTDFFVGGATSGRSNPETHGVVGLFVNDVPYRSDVSAGCTLSDLLEKVKVRALNVYRHQEYPFERIVRLAAPLRSLDRHPVFQHALTLQPRQRDETSVTMAELNVSAFPTRAEGSALDLTFSLHFESDGLHLAADYATDLWDEESISVLADNFLLVLQSAETDDRTPLDNLGLIQMPGEASGHRSAIREDGTVDTEGSDPSKSLSETGENKEVGLEDVIMGVFRAILGQDIGPDIDFFSAGGDSIGALRLVARLRGITEHHVTVRDLFRSPTPAALTKRVQSQGTENAGSSSSETDFAVLHEPEGPTVPLLPMQSWLVASGPLPDSYNFSAMVRSEDAINGRLFKRAVAVALKRHDATRWRFRRAGEGLEAELLDGPGHGLLEVMEPTGRSTEDVAVSVAQHVADIQHSLVVDGDGPLVRVVLYNYPDGTARILFAATHLVMDVVSMHVIVEDIFGAYDSLVQHRPIELLPMSTDSADWSRAIKRWSEGADAAPTALAWSLVEATYPVHLPVDHHDGADTVEHEKTTHYRLTADETAALRASLVRMTGVTVEHTLLWATGGALGHLVGSRGIVLDMETHGRADDFLVDQMGNSIEASRTVGWLTSIYPFALPTGQAADAPGCLRIVAQLARAVPDCGLTYGALAASGQLSWCRRDVSFSFMGSIESTSVGSKRSYVTLDPGPSRHPGMQRRHKLEVDALIADGVLRVSLTYSASQLNLSTVDAVGAGIVERLREVGRSE